MNRTNLYLRRSKIILIILLAGMGMVLPGLGVYVFALDETRKNDSQTQIATTQISISQTAAATKKKPLIQETDNSLDGAKKELQPIIYQDVSHMDIPENAKKGAEETIPDISDDEAAILEGNEARMLYKAGPSINVLVYVSPGYKARYARSAAIEKKIIQIKGKNPPRNRPQKADIKKTDTDITALASLASVLLEKESDHEIQGENEILNREKKNPDYWLSHAVEPKEKKGLMIAIVIDDLGVDIARTHRSIALPAPMTMAFLPYGYDLDELTRQARDNGHELMLHLPMEPVKADIDPGPNALFSHLNKDELFRRIEWNLSRFNGYVGINNHMGSRATSNKKIMEWLLSFLRDRGLAFLDSVTSNRTVGYSTAKKLGVPYAVRDVFLDHVKDKQAIRRQMRKLENIAIENGSAIAIAHPYDETFSVLHEWAKTAEKRGFRLVPVSTVIKHRLSYIHKKG